MSRGGDAFAAYVAHELRTPLATQRALLELALGDREMQVAAWREIGAEVLFACRRQERLLEACLTLARIEGAPERLEPVDLSAVAEEALRAHDRRALTTAAALEPAWTAGDPRLVERLAANLVSNAIRHNVDGGRIEIATRTKSGRALLTVANTGRPVPIGELGRLVRPFQQLGHGATPRDGGVGLGLAIVQAVADVHHATLAVRARRGGGLGVDVGFPALAR